MGILRAPYPLIQKWLLGEKLNFTRNLFLQAATTEYKSNVQNNSIHSSVVMYLHKQSFPSHVSYYHM